MWQLHIEVGQWPHDILIDKQLPGSFTNTKLDEWLKSVSADAVSNTERHSGTSLSSRLALANEQPLDERYRDHALTGDWNDRRDCHIKPDLILIYRKPDSDVLQLVRLGSHSELSL